MAILAKMTIEIPVELKEKIMKEYDPLGWVARTLENAMEKDPIRRLRVSYGMSRNRMAKHLSCSPHTIQRWEESGAPEKVNYLAKVNERLREQLKEQVQGINFDDRIKDSRVLTQLWQDKHKGLLNRVLTKTGISKEDFIEQAGISEQTFGLYALDEMPDYVKKLLEEIEFYAETLEI